MFFIQHFLLEMKYFFSFLVIFLLFGSSLCWFRISSSNSRVDYVKRIWENVKKAIWNFRRNIKNIYKVLLMFIILWLILVVDTVFVDLLSEFLKWSIRYIKHNVNVGNDPNNPFDTYKFFFVVLFFAFWKYIYTTVTALFICNGIYHIHMTTL